MDKPRARPLIHLFPQPGNMDVDDVVDGRAARRLFPDIAREHVTRHDLPLMVKQVIEQVELARGQIDRLIPSPYAAADWIEFEVAESDAQRLFRAAAAQQRSEPRDEFGESERLDKVIVGAAVEAEDAILTRVTRGQNEYGNGQATAAQSGQDLQTLRPGRPRSSKMRSNGSLVARK